MKFSEWLKQSGVKQRKVATLLNTGKSRISRIANGKILPRRDEFVSIYVMSNGLVPPNDFFDLPTMPPEPNNSHSSGAA